MYFVLRPCDVPLQYQIRVTCNKGTRNTREARLVRLSDGLKLMINEAAGRVLVKPYAPGIRLSNR